MQASYLEEKYELHLHQTLRIVQSQSFSQPKESDHLPYIEAAAWKDTG